MSESDDVLLSNHGSPTAPANWATDEILPPIVIPPEQLEPIRDRWMRPLVDRIAALERDVGRLAAERDQARRDATVAIDERDQARRERDDLAGERDQLQSERDALLATRTTLRDRIKALEYKVRSAQDTTALRAIEAYDIPRQRSLRQRQHRHRVWWAFWKRP